MYKRTLIFVQFHLLLFKIISKVSAADVVLKQHCNTLHARKQSTSESRARRGSCEPLVTFEARKVCQKRMTLSSRSSSHRLSFSLSDPRTRMSSVRTGSVIICAMPVLGTGLSCSGVLNWGADGKEIKSGGGTRATHSLLPSSSRTNMHMRSFPCLSTPHRY